jgi:hypothetical protein
MFSNKTIEFDSAIENVIEQVNSKGEELVTERLKEQIYRIFFQMEQHFDSIRTNYFKESLFSQVLCLINEKIKQFLASREK